MAIQVSSSFDLKSKEQNFKRDSFETLEEMKNFPETSLPPIFHAMCEADGKMYVYSVNNDTDATTGKWREMVSGAGADEIYIGADEPTDENVSLWINPNELGGGGTTLGNGLPNGGTAGQILSKVDDTDGNAQWIDISNFSGSYNDLTDKPTINNFPTGGTDGQFLVKDGDVEGAVKWVTIVDGNGVGY